MQETWVGPLGWEDALEEDMANHFNILLWRISWTDEPGGIWIHGISKGQTKLSD